MIQSPKQNKIDSNVGEQVANLKSRAQPSREEKKVNRKSEGILKKEFTTAEFGSPQGIHDSKESFASYDQVALPANKSKILKPKNSKNKKAYEQALEQNLDGPINMEDLLPVEE